MEGGQELTVEAVNWAAWCHRDLMLEIRERRIKARLPIRLRYVEIEDSAEGDRCVLRWTGRWRPHRVDGEIILQPWARMWNPTTQRATPWQVDEAYSIRLASAVMPTLPLSRLPEVADDHSRAVAELEGRVISLNLWLTGALNEVKTIPFRVRDAKLNGAHLVIQGDAGISLDVQADTLTGLRTFPDEGEWIIDLWSEDAGYRTSVRVHGAPPSGQRERRRESGKQPVGEEKNCQDYGAEHAEATQVVARELEIAPETGGQLRLPL